MNHSVALRPLLKLAVGCALLQGCVASSRLRGKVDEIGAIVDQAEANGALKCAPHELALAKAHLKFAKTDLDQGELSKADTHVDTARVNARTALFLSPASRCSEKGGELADRDGDGIGDKSDKCPDQREVWNEYHDEDGCPDDPDTDDDHVADSVDSCVLEPEDVDGYLDEDGCPDVDNDADGVLDGVDKCPGSPEDLDGFEDADGCPDNDNDKDTVADVLDQCPNTAGVPGGAKPGCPRFGVVLTPREIRISQQIQFELNRAAIKKVSWPILDAVRDVLRDNSKITIEVQGHTDNTGNAQRNLKLSQSRADAVKGYLVSHGISPTRLTSRGYGMTQPLMPNSTAENRALNRRVQFIRTDASAQ